MTRRPQSAPAKCNLIGYTFRALPSENTRTTLPLCHLLGDNDEEPQSGARGYGAEVFHLIGDMILEDDCA